MRSSLVALGVIAIVACLALLSSAAVPIQAMISAQQTSELASTVAVLPSYRIGPDGSAVQNKRDFTIMVSLSNIALNFINVKVPQDIWRFVGDAPKCTTAVGTIMVSTRHFGDEVSFFNFDVEAGSSLLIECHDVYFDLSQNLDTDFTFQVFDSSYQYKSDAVLRKINDPQVVPFARSSDVTLQPYTSISTSGINRRDFRLTVISLGVDVSRGDTILIRGEKDLFKQSQSSSVLAKCKINNVPVKTTCKSSSSNILRLEAPNGFTVGKTITIDCANNWHLDFNHYKTKSVSLNVRTAESLTSTTISNLPIINDGDDDDVDPPTPTKKWAEDFDIFNEDMLDDNGKQIPNKRNWSIYIHKIYNGLAENTPITLDMPLNVMVSKSGSKISTCRVGTQEDVPAKFDSIIGQLVITPPLSTRQGATILKIECPDIYFDYSTHYYYSFFVGIYIDDNISTKITTTLRAANDDGMTWELTPFGKFLVGAFLLGAIAVGAFLIYKIFIAKKPQPLDQYNLQQPTQWQQHPQQQQPQQQHQQQGYQPPNVNSNGYQPM